MSTTPTHPAPAGPDGAEIDELLYAVAAEGRVRDKTAAEVRAIGRRFQRWCIENEMMESTEPEDFAALPASMLSSLIVAYLSDISTGLKTKSLKSYKTDLFAWCFQHSIDAADARIPTAALVKNQKYRTDSSSGLGVIDRDDAEIRAARPVLWDDCVMIVNHIDSLKAETYGVTKLWLLGMRTFQLVQWHGLFRCSEAAVHMTWKWWTDGDDFMMTPGDDVLKYQPEELPAPFQHRLNLDLCCHHALRKWKAALKRAGFKTGPNDPVFPAIARTERIAESDAWCAPVRNFYGEAVAEAAKLDLEVGSAEHQYWLEAPIKEQRKRWADGLKELHLSAGFTARHAGERISSHGNRRGPATQMHKNGGTVPQIAAALRHQDITATHRYIHLEPDEVLNTSDINLDQKAHPTTGASATMTTFAATAAAPEPQTCEVVHPDGTTCGRAVKARVTVGSDWLACCQAHYQRAHNKGMTKAEFTKPIGDHLLPEGCEVVHPDGTTCGKEIYARATVDSVVYACCTAHFWRARNKGMTKAEFIKPIRAWTPRAKVKTP
jgi:hypothetical protein